jgi:hypothetical protein
VEQVPPIVNMQCVIHSHILFLNALYTTLKAAVVNLLCMQRQSTAYILPLLMALFVVILLF